ncbi:hypothetical protein VC279_15615 [Xanthomonas sp. WHRI 10064A]|uniref:hypothetical protein n=1 Tax=unclassified Xanthomonas TaxID=2643310 RepID=UPI002B22AC87|nr:MULTISPECIES: hypothetical protein [unclassified Xanthomonas]MEA9586891.1 hypothetical protein [Xanthomonas sp. WHRI 10064B]MEA9616082.1 hypothetical protein [Xanthomonas sp. WHRI 10064A]
MTTTSHYHDRIARATERLAQLQAKELLANQRREAKTKETARREEMKRRRRVADLVISTGAHMREEAELKALLISHMKGRGVSLH